MNFTSLPDKTENLGSLPQQGTQIFGSHSPAYLPGCVKKLLIFSLSS